MNETEAPRPGVLATVRVEPRRWSAPPPPPPPADPVADARALRSAAEELLRVCDRRADLGSRRIAARVRRALASTRLARAPRRGASTRAPRSSAPVRSAASAAPALAAASGDDAPPPPPPTAAPLRGVRPVSAALGVETEPFELPFEERLRFDSRARRLLALVARGDPRVNLALGDEHYGRAVAGRLETRRRERDARRLARVEGAR